MPFDNSAAAAASPSHPAAGGAAVTPHDTNPLATTARSLWIGGAGNVKVTAVDGSTPTFVGVPAGTILPIRCTHVWSVGTSATSIVALF